MSLRSGIPGQTSKISETKSFASKLRNSMSPNDSQTQTQPQTQQHTQQQLQPQAQSQSPTQMLTQMHSQCNPQQQQPSKPQSEPHDSTSDNSEDHNLSRPRLRVQTPSFHIDPKTVISSPSTAPTPQSYEQRRFWFRKKSGGAATSLIVNNNELVDDIKLRVLEKYPTSLRIKCDPADLVLTLQNHSGMKLELQPDENIVSVIDHFFPNGMMMRDAVEVGPVSSAWISLDKQKSSSRSASRSSVRTNRSASIHTDDQQSPQQQQTLPSQHIQHIHTSPHTQSKPHTPVDIDPNSPRRKRGTNVLLLPRPLPVNPQRAYADNEHADADDENNEHADNTEHDITERIDHADQHNDEHTEQHTGSGNRGDEVELEVVNDAQPISPGVERKVSGSLWQLQQRFSPSFQLSQQGKVVVVPQINVLIVEDNPVNQRLLEAFMKRKKVRYALANNGREALEMWKAGGFHLIFMDIQLPVMTGLEATKEIRRLEVVNGIGAFSQKTKRQKLDSINQEDMIKKSAGGFRSPVIIVALTASNDRDDKSDALAAGCNDFLTKPVSFSWLEKKIIEWGCMQALIDYDGWKQWNQQDEDVQQIAVTPV